jgi:division protein CdvB (Snf7/Vps24/ESCRT-III family)
MHCEANIKFISAQQARSIYNFRNIKDKLQKTIAYIWFNKICKAEQLQSKIYSYQSRLVMMADESLDVN